MARILGPDGNPLAILSKAPINDNWAAYLSRYMQYLPNPDNITLDTYQEMLDCDESVSSGVEFAVLAALCKLGDYTHPKKRVQKFVREQLAGIPGSFNVQVAEIGTAVPFGFSVTEILWALDGSRYVVNGLQTLVPQSIVFDLFKEGPEKNRIQTIYQWRGRAEETVIPTTNAVVYSHNSRFGNPYGRSRLKAAYPCYFLKKVMMKSWGYAMQRYGAPISWAKVKDGGRTIAHEGKSYSGYQWAQRQLDSLSVKSNLVFDGETEFGMQYPDHAFGADFEAIVGYCNKMIYRACLVPPLVADHGSSGSYALGGVHYDMFDLANTKLLNEMEQFLIEQLIRPLVTFNFGPQEGYGHFARRQMRTSDMSLLADFVSKMTQSNFLSDQDLEDLNYVRALAGLPLRETVFEKKEPVSSAAPGRPDDQKAPDKTKEAPKDAAGKTE